VGTRILSVEDDERIRTAVKLALEDEGWTVEEAETGEDAIVGFDRAPTDVVLIESGGDNLTLTFSPALVDFFIYVIDVGAGDKIPRKNGPGITQSDILVINKTDLAPYVGASLEVMDRDSKLMRGEKPYVFTNCKTGEGIDRLVELIRENVLFDLAMKAPA